MNNNVMGYFKPSSGLPQQSKLPHENLSGMQTLSIVIEGSEGAFLRVSALQSLQDLQRDLKDMGKFDRSFSFADFVSMVHSGLDDKWSGSVYLPGDNAMVEEYMSLIGHRAAASFVSEDYSQARILIRHAIHSSTKLNQAVAEIRQYAAKHLDPTLKFEVTGGSYLSSQAADYMISGQLRSLLLIMLMIFPPIARFGLLSSMVMLLAMVSSFVVIPLLLRGHQIAFSWKAETRALNVH